MSHPPHFNFFYNLAYFRFLSDFLIHRVLSYVCWCRPDNISIPLPVSYLSFPLRDAIVCRLNNIALSSFAYIVSFILKAMFLSRIIFEQNVAKLRSKQQLRTRKQLAYRESTCVMISCSYEIIIDSVHITSRMHAIR